MLACLTAWWDPSLARRANPNRATVAGNVRNAAESVKNRSLARPRRKQGFHPLLASRAGSSFTARPPLQLTNACLGGGQRGFGGLARFRFGGASRFGGIAGAGGRRNIADLFPGIGVPAHRSLFAKPQEQAHWRQQQSALGIHPHPYILARSATVSHQLPRSSFALLVDDYV